MQKLLKTGNNGPYLHSTFKSCSNSRLLSFKPPQPSPNPNPNCVSGEHDALRSSKPGSQTIQISSRTDEGPLEREPISRNRSTVQISRPWPEWTALMQLLLERGYFEAHAECFRNGEQLGSKEMNWIRTACLNFARDRSELIRYFSRKDIQIISGCGCPSLDRKVVNSGKRLRAHVGISEGNVCSSCNLRGECDRAYIKAREEEGGRTVDVMRILLTYGLDSVAGTLENRPRQYAMVKESVKMLMKEMVEFSNQLDSDIPNGTSLKTVTPVQGYTNPKDKGHINVPMKQGDWICPKCNFLNFARNIKCLRCNGFYEERLKQLREDQDQLPLKKGDWICQRCNFLNFAKNTRCLQCEEKPLNRHLNPGEWECESCNYINFRRNMVCLKCDHRRPKASTVSNASSHFGHEANDHKSMGIGRTKQDRGAAMWSFVEEERKDDHSISGNKDSTFVDFPIMGGKSTLSQNPQKRERWKLEMLERSKTNAKTQDNDEEYRHNHAQRRWTYVDSTDDEDIAEWFGHAK